MQNQTPTQQPQGNYHVPRKNKIWGVILLVAPICLLFLVIIAYAATSFIFNTEATEEASVVANLVKVILGLLGLIAVIGIPAGLVLGIVLLTRKKLVQK